MLTLLFSSSSFPRFALLQGRCHFCFHVSVGCFHLSFAVAEIIEDTKRVVMISARWNLAVGPMLMMGGAFATVVSLTLLGERNAPKPQDEVSLPSQQRKL
jgi:hypothetical protein